MDIRPCAGIERQGADCFNTQHIGSYAFSADIILRNNFVTFKAIGQYDSIRWKIDTDPREFEKPDAACFSDDDGKHELKKTLTIVESFEKPLLTKIACKY